MRDYNFFDNFKAVKVQRDKKVITAMFVMLFIFLLIAGFYSYNAYSISVLQSRLEKLDESIIALKTNDDIARVRRKVEIEKNLSQVVIGVDDAKKEIEDYNIIDENLLAIITDAIPSDIELTFFSISGYEIKVSGVALSKPAIAEFQHNFKDSEIITEVFVSNITGNETDYKFSAILTIGGEQNENIQ